MILDLPRFDPNVSMESMNRRSWAYFKVPVHARRISKVLSHGVLTDLERKSPTQVNFDRAITELITEL